MSGGGEERVEEQQGATEMLERFEFMVGRPMIRVEDIHGTRVAVTPAAPMRCGVGQLAVDVRVVSQPETASESAGADATGNQGE